MIKKIIYFILLLCFLLFLVSVVYQCAADRRPANNNQEYLKQHGYVEGQVNEIRLGEVLLRFPAGVKYSPRTTGKIVKGVADQIETGIYYPYLDGDKSLVEGVRIDLHYGGVEIPEERDKAEKKEEWQEIINRDDIGLIEYHMEKYDGAWGYITYVAKSDEDRTPRGGLIRYACKGYPEGHIIECWNDAYLHKSNIMVRYFISGVNIKNWKEIHQKVVSFVDSIIVEE